MVSYHRLVNVFIRRLFTGQFTAKPCSHLDMINEVEPSSDVCDQCVELGETWPALRMCLVCGRVGCCEDARYQHALNHYGDAGHPLVRPYLERGANWVWCHEDEALLDPV